MYKWIELNLRNNTLRLSSIENGVSLLFDAIPTVPIECVYSELNVINTLLLLGREEDLVSNSPYIDQLCLHLTKLKIRTGLFAPSSYECEKSITGTTELYPCDKIQGVDYSYTKLVENIDKAANENGIRAVVIALDYIDFAEYPIHDKRVDEKLACALKKLALKFNLMIFVFLTGHPYETWYVVDKMMGLIPGDGYFIDVVETAEFFD